MRIASRLKYLTHLIHFCYEQNSYELNENDIANAVYHILNDNKDQNTISWHELTDTLKDIDKMFALTRGSLGKYMKKSFNRTKDQYQINQKKMLGWECSKLQIHRIYCQIKNILSHPDCSKKELRLRLQILEKSVQIYDEAIQHDQVRIKTQKEKLHYITRHREYQDNYTIPVSLFKKTTPEEKKEGLTDTGHYIEVYFKKINNKFHAFIYNTSKAILTSPPDGTVFHHEIEPTKKTVYKKPKQGKKKKETVDVHHILPSVLVFNDKRDAYRYQHYLRFISTASMPSNLYKKVCTYQIYLPHLITTEDLKIIHPCHKKTYQKRSLYEDMTKIAQCEILGLNEISNLNIHPYETQIVGNCVYAATHRGMSSVLIQESPSRSTSSQKILDKIHQEQLKFSLSTKSEEKFIQRSAVSMIHSLPTLKEFSQGKIPYVKHEKSHLDVRHLYRKHVTDTPAKTININIYGNPHTGKTTFSKALGCMFHPGLISLNLDGCLINNEDFNAEKLTELVKAITRMSQDNRLWRTALYSIFDLSRNHLLIIDNAPNELNNSKLLCNLSKHFNVIVVSNQPFDSINNTYEVLPLNSRQQHNWIMHSGIVNKARKPITYLQRKQPWILSSPTFMKAVLDILKKSPRTNIDEVSLMHAEIDKHFKHIGTQSAIILLKDITLKNFQGRAYEKEVIEIPGLMHFNAKSHEDIIIQKAKQIGWCTMQQDGLYITNKIIDTFLIALCYVDPGIVTPIIDIRNYINNNFMFSHFFSHCVYILLREKEAQQQFILEFLNISDVKFPKSIIALLKELKIKYPKNKGFFIEKITEVAEAYSIDPDKIYIRSDMQPALIHNHSEKFIGTKHFGFNTQEKIRENYNLIDENSEFQTQFQKFYHAIQSDEPYDNLYKSTFRSKQNLTKLEPTNGTYSEYAKSYYCLSLVLDHQQNDREFLPWLFLGLTRYNCTHIPTLECSYANAIHQLDLNPTDLKVLQKLIILSLEEKTHNPKAPYTVHSPINSKMISMLHNHRLYCQETVSAVFDQLLKVYIEDEENPHTYNFYARDFLINSYQYNPKWLNSIAIHFYQKYWPQCLLEEDSFPSMDIHLFFHSVLNDNFYKKRIKKWGKWISMNTSKITNPDIFIKNITSSKLKLKKSIELVTIHHFQRSFIGIIKAYLRLQSSDGNKLNPRALQIKTLPQSYVESIIENEINTATDNESASTYITELVRIQQGINSKHYVYNDNVSNDIDQFDNLIFQVAALNRVDISIERIIPFITRKKIDHCITNQLQTNIISHLECYDDQNILHILDYFSSESLILISNQIQTRNNNQKLIELMYRSFYKHINQNNDYFFENYYPEPDNEKIYQHIITTYTPVTDAMQQNAIIDFINDPLTNDFKKFQGELTNHPNKVKNFGSESHVFNVFNKKPTTSVISSITSWWQPMTPESSMRNYWPTYPNWALKLINEIGKMRKYGSVIQQRMRTVLHNTQLKICQSDHRMLSVFIENGCDLESLTSQLQKSYPNGNTRIAKSSIKNQARNVKIRSHRSFFGDRLIESEWEDDFISSIIRLTQRSYFNAQNKHTIKFKKDCIQLFSQFLRKDQYENTKLLALKALILLDTNYSIEILNDLKETQPHQLSAILSNRKSMFNDLELPEELDHLITLCTLGELSP